MRQQTISSSSLHLTLLRLTILFFVIDNCTGTCDKLPYRHGVYAVCQDSYGKSISCYNSNLPTGATVNFKCAAHYAPAKKSYNRFGIRPNPTLTCKRNGAWLNYSNFQLLSCLAECGVPQTSSVSPQIINGTITSTAFFPWAGALFYYKYRANQFSFLCGATLIESPDETEGFLILTAAHCITEERLPFMQVALGSDTSDYEDAKNDKNVQIFEVKQAISAENYSPRDGDDFHNDIGILRLKGRVCLTDRVLPACLPHDPDPSQVGVNDYGEIVGFGLTTPENPNASKYLRLARLPVVPVANCNDWWRKRPLDHSELCVGYRADGSGTCYGDSGGGLVFKHQNENKYYVHGIVSHGPTYGKGSILDCKTYSVFTKVAPYLPWIHSIQFDDSGEISTIDPDKCQSSTSPPPVASTTTMRPTTTTTTAPWPTFSDVPTFPPQPEYGNAYQELGLQIHNKYRQRHDVGPLKLSNFLNQRAQLYADKLIRENNFINVNGIGDKFLKNIFHTNERGIYRTDTEIVQKAVDLWYSSSSEYNRNDPKPTTFTQMVWKSTTDIGIGLSTTGIKSNGERRTVVIAAYSPPGNTVGENGGFFHLNVFI